MGCHTWCYAHIPEKSEEWKTQYKEIVRKNLESSRQNIKSFSDEEIRYFIDADLTENKAWVDEYFQGSEEVKKEYLQEYGYSKKQMEEYLKSLPVNKDYYTTDSYRKRMLNENQSLLDALQMLDTIKYMNTFSFLGDPIEYGLFEIKDGKIYRETTTKNCGFDKSYHDIFRLYDYDAKPCHSIEETLDRCEEYKIDWNDPENDLEKLKEFWQTYPDGIIEFG